MIESIRDFVSLVADGCTAILGIFAIFALIKHRKKLNAFVRLLASTVINERIRRIRCALTRFDQLNYGVKEDRKEIVAILGELAGMIRGLAKRDDDFKRVYDELVGYSSANVETFTEASKRRLSQELYNLLEEQSMTAALNLIQDSHGPKSD